MNTRQRLAYGMLGAPLAMAALPVYIHTPKLYGDDFGLGLAATGAILLGSRAIDTLQDPWLGRLADYMQRRQGGWKMLMVTAALLLGFAYTALFNPPGREGFSLGAWFAACLVLVYTAHSALTITYLTWGARASSDTHERTRLIAFREGFALAGVVLASLLPMLFTQWLDAGLAWLLLSLVFAAVLAPSVWVLLRHVSVPQPVQTISLGILQPLRHEPFRRLATLFFLNGLAVAIAATLSLFYIADVLQLESYSGAFLALYFVSGAISLPLWLILTRRLDKTITWMIGSILAVTGFVWAVQLGAGDIVPYVIVCMLSGAALGADLVLPTAIAADIIPQQDHGRTASYFGIWSLISKAVLALSAGMALPLLAVVGYRPGEQAGLEELALLYAGVPSIIKLFSAALLLRWRSSLEIRHAI
ncbi:MAG: MFS transporter [Gammaproteobacteria bacterium]|nr:MFS transporter [Gammaproteobacteria bacterium]